jgi:Helix-turn-helix domain
MKRHDDQSAQAWSPEAVRQLGLTTDIETAASVLGIGRTLAYELARTNRFPVRLLRHGRRIVVPVMDLLRYLGVE